MCYSYDLICKLLLTQAGSETEMGQAPGIHWLPQVSLV